jgi:hypothetical protein
MKLISHVSMDDVFSLFRAYCDRPSCILSNVSFEQPRSIACCPTSLAMLNSFIFDPLVGGPKQRWAHGDITGPLVLRVTTATSRLVSPRSNKVGLAHIYKYLLTILQIEVVTIVNVEILDYMWTLSSAFCRVYSVEISILHMPNWEKTC